MKKTTILAAAILLLFSALSFAQEAPKDKEPKNCPRKEMRNRMNFSEEQKAKMKDFRADMQKKEIAIKAKVQTSRIELRELLTAEKPDKSAIEKKINEIAKIEVEQKMNFINHWDQVNQILTPEQKKLWKNNLRFFEKRGKRGMIRPAGMNRHDRREMRGPGKMRGEMFQFDRPDAEFDMPCGDLAEFQAPDMDNQGFGEDDIFANITEYIFDEIFENDNDMPAPPEINPPDNELE